MCNSCKNDKNKKSSLKNKGDNMAKALSSNVYKTLNLNPKTLKEITVRPKVKNGKLLFNRNNKEHRYIIEE